MQSRSGIASSFRKAGSTLTVALLLHAGSVLPAHAEATCAGTVINLSCDTVRPAGGVARCDAGEQVLALAVDGRRGLQPLVLAGGPSLERLRSGALTGRQVRVVGSCPPSGAIHVEEVVPLG